MTHDAPRPSLSHPARFDRRHIGPGPSEVEAMLASLGLGSLDELVEKTIPGSIRLRRPLDLGAPKSEHALLEDLRVIAQRNELWRSFIGTGYYGTLTPADIQRNILENPGWYTQYTPYQAEISQGRLEALLNFQTMVADLTGLDIANASMLDEATAAGDAMFMVRSVAKKADSNRFLVSAGCHPQTIDLLRTRARPLGIEIVVSTPADMDFSQGAFGVLLQYPDSWGHVRDDEQLIATAHAAGALVIVATDLLSLCLLRPPGEIGADVVIGSSQRFGVPMGFGGPHAAFFATRDEYKRSMPGRLVGVSRDAQGKQALRLALQTREQHIRREKATSNICTAQVLLAIMASMYAVYHGPGRLKQLASRVHYLTQILAAGLRQLGLRVENEVFFDTLRVVVAPEQRERILTECNRHRVNLRTDDLAALGVSLDQTASPEDLVDLLACFAAAVDGAVPPSVDDLAAQASWTYAAPFARRSEFLAHPVFNTYHSETELLRYIHRLQARDLSLTTSMIPLGSCTMKLNATSEMLPVTWPEFGQLHPFVPAEQARGYRELFEGLERMLCEITGFARVSLQPNAGSQGEYAGLMGIRAYHEDRGDVGRNICLIPQSAHGTNPASAAMAGF
ncbi:MAG: aminomethyl-transferring glycine dehydrogenase, partial [Myxococcota bacterium]